MVGAILKVHLRNGFFVTNGGFKYNLVLIVTFFALAGVGGGSWSLDAALGLDLTGAVWALAALAVGIVGGPARSSSAAATGRAIAATAARRALTRPEATAA